MHPTRRGIAIVGTGLLVAALPILVSARLWPPWAVFWVLVVLLFGLDALLLPREKDVTVTADVPELAPMGCVTAVPLHVVVRGAWKGRLRIRSELSETLAPTDEVACDVAAGKGEAAIELRPLRRGPATLDAIWLRAVGTLGLMASVHRYDLTQTTHGVPDARSVRRTALTFFARDEQQAGSKILQSAGDGSEFDSLREYQQGMDHRTIDWKSSARHTRLLSRQFRAERNQQIIFAIDTGRLMAEPLDGLPRLDHAIHAAMTLAYVSARLGDRVGMYAFDERPRASTEPRGGLGAFRAIQEVSSELSYSTGETNYTLGLTNLGVKLRRRSLVVVMTDFEDTVTAELMIDNLSRLAGKHLVLFVALRDPAVGRLAAAEPSSLRALDRAVIADTLLRERELVIKRLRRRGILCLDAIPSRVGSDLVNRYLEVKRREMI